MISAVGPYGMDAYFLGHVDVVMAGGMSPWR